MNQPGPVYDNALKFLASTDLDGLCRWLGIPPAPGAVPLSEALPGQAMQADLLVESAADCISQVEFVTHVTSDLARRLVAYRARVMERHPGRSLQQHVLVLGRGTVARALRDRDEFWMRVHVFYARDQDPTGLVRNPSLAPLAVLGRAAGAKERRALFRDALRTIVTSADPARREELGRTAATLAAIRLDRTIIERIGKEIDVPIDLRDTDVARSFLREGLEEGRAEGWARSLRWRFGRDDRIGRLAVALAHLPQDEAEALATAAESIDALEQAVSSRQ